MFLFMFYLQWDGINLHFLQSGPLSLQLQLYLYLPLSYLWQHCFSSLLGLPYQLLGLLQRPQLPFLLTLLFPLFPQ